MQIFISGFGQAPTITLDVHPHLLISEVKQLLADRIGYDGDHLRLVYGLHALQDDQTLEEAHIESESTLFQSIDLSGGAKKRKKKNFAKPKKTKHKKKKVKLAVLKFYRVSGKEVTYLRQQCPRCGPGVFMAAHKTRNYCGRCGDIYYQNQNKI